MHPTPLQSPLALPLPFPYTAAHLPIGSSVFPVFAIVDIAGFQEKVKVGEKITVPTLATEDGKSMSFGNVFLVVTDNGEIMLGAPFVSGVSVEAKVLEHGRTDKIRVYKMRRRKRYRRTHGHRQGTTTIEITGIKGVKEEKK